MFAWRPHAEHLHFLADLAKVAGHSISFLSCDGAFRSCYNIEAGKSSRKASECAKCTLGGVRSYASSGVTSARTLRGGPKVDSQLAHEWASSSASTLGRHESDQDFLSTEMIETTSRLAVGVDRAFGAAVQWIERESLGCVVVFNGRMDITRAIVEAAKYCRVPYFSYERTWFGDGIQILPNENCLGLKAVTELVRVWAQRPLLKDQAFESAALVASRFLRTNSNEWRAYNKHAVGRQWPTSGDRKVLFVPGSRNEVWSHPDWSSGWKQRTDGFDFVIEELGLGNNEMVLRCHPNWATSIHGKGGEKAEIYYGDWAKSRGVHLIPSNDPTSTLSLIEQSDAVVVSGGSAAFEAGLLGRQVIALGPSVYQGAGFESSFYGPLATGTPRNLQLETGKDLEASRQRSALRFGYSMNHRASQFVPFVRCVSPVEYEYRPGADPAQLDRLVRTEKLEADDNTSAANDGHEREVLDLVNAREWDQIVGWTEASKNAEKAPTTRIERRPLVRPLDSVRHRLPKGDI